MKVARSIVAAMAGLLLLPGLSLAVPTSRNSDEALRLMTDIRHEADLAARNLDSADTGAWSLMTSWKDHAQRLDTIKTAINRMGSDYSRLQNMESTVAPWEKKAIDQTFPLLQEMAVHTRDAIDYLNHDQINLWRPQFQKFESSLDGESHDLAREMSEYVRYGNVHSAEKQLERKLDRQAAS